ncbi:MAG: hypothetical protein U1E45_17260 [Geminicoccaceae bacterium]
MYGNGQYGSDPECGGTDRAYYNQLYNSQAVVISQDEMIRIDQATRGAAWYRCGYCNDKAICWPRPGYDAFASGNGPPPDDPDDTGTNYYPQEQTPAGSPPWLPPAAPPPAAPVGAADP